MEFLLTGVVINSEQTESDDEDAAAATTSSFYIIQAHIFAYKAINKTILTSVQSIDSDWKIYFSQPQFPTETVSK